jgi:HPr kinase/phosphorylase
MPVAPGRSLGVLVEVAARNQLLRTRGLNAARDLANRLAETLREKEIPTDADAEDDVEQGGQV